MRLPRLLSLTLALRETALRFPLPSVFALVTTAIFITAVQTDFEEEALMRFALITALGFVASLLGDLLAEARVAATRMRLAGQAVIVLLLFAFSYFLLPDRVADARPPFWYVYFILLFALHLGIALVPAVNGSGPQVLWRFNLICFLRFFFSSVNAALLFAGLALALVSVDKLFELGLDDALYPQVWIVCAFLAHPLLFLGGLPRPEALPAEQPFPKALRFTLRFIGLPLVGLYLLILYAYVAKIGLQWDWPDGWVAMPIFILAVISLLSYVLSLPLAASEPWARLYHRWLFRLLLPLALVLFLALQVRLGDYGMTINRYLGLALALWLFGISLAYLLRPGLKIGWMPFSLLLVCLFSIAAGPLGAFDWSERAQAGRVRDMAMRMNVLENGTFVLSTDPQEAELVAEFESALRYLLGNFGVSPLEAELSGFLAKHPGSSFRNRNGRYLANRVLEYLQLQNNLENASVYYHADRSVLPTFSLPWMIEFGFYPGRQKREFLQTSNLDETTLRFSVDPSGKQLTLHADESELTTIDLTPWAAEIRTRVENYGNTSSEDPIFWRVETGGWRFVFVCTNAQINSHNSAFRSAQMSVFAAPPGERSEGN